ncbi:MAG: hypothetical protein V4641_07500 [Pseudomonadota bacterium]|jgi:hypothetical protein
MGLINKMALAGALCTLINSTSAQASQISYAYTVRIDEIYLFNGNDISGMPMNATMPTGGQTSVGDILTGTFSFDQDRLDLPPASQTPTSKYFSDTAGNAHSLNFSGPGGASFVSAESPYNGVLQLEHSAYDLFAITHFNATVTTGLVLANWQGGALHSLDLPSDMKLSNFSYTWFSTSWWIDQNHQIDVRGSVTSLLALSNTSPVPEPAMWTTLLAGLAGLACATFQKRISKNPES